MSKPPSKIGRYLLFLDLLGFSELVSKGSTEQIYSVVDEALQAFGRWEKINSKFRVIYFSDTIIFYQESVHYGDWAFYDIYAIGAMVFTALLARGIPTRGAITFGEFEVRQDTSGRHAIYFGRALVEAYRSEQRENWIGISIEPSAWIPFEESSPGSINQYVRDRAWLRRHDGTLLLNPFIKITGWHDLFLAGEIGKPYSAWDAPEFSNEIEAFRFLRTEAEEHVARGDFTGRVASKYHATIAFLKEVLGAEIYAWGAMLGDED